MLYEAVRMVSEVLADLWMVGQVLLESRMVGQVLRIISQRRIRRELLSYFRMLTEKAPVEPAGGALITIAVAVAGRARMSAVKLVFAVHERVGMLLDIRPNLGMISQIPLESRMMLHVLRVVDQIRVGRELLGDLRMLVQVALIEVGNGIVLGHRRRAQRADQ